MNAKLNNFIDRAKNPRDKNFRSHFYIFLICCGISLFIWFLIKMNDDYMAEISIPVSYKNIPADKLLNNSDDRITIRLRANGGDLFSAKYLSLRGNIDIDLNQAELKKSRYFDRYYILTSQFRNQLSEGFDFTHTMLTLSPDTIFLKLEDIISRSLPVIPQIDVSCKPQYMIYDSIKSSPSMIMISGPASIIDTLTHLSTERRSFSNLDKNKEIMIPIILPVSNKKITYSETDVNVIIPVEQFTESSIYVIVNGISFDNGITAVRTFPESIQLTYQIAIKDYKLVKPEMFTVSAVYDPAKDKDKTFLKVKIDNSPDFVKITRISPDKVEYIIQK